MGGPCVLRGGHKWSVNIGIFLDALDKRGQIRALLTKPTEVVVSTISSKVFL